MSATITYDLPVKDLIDELSATGHVTHKSFNKTSVTFHHNAGRLSHEGVLNVWKTRPASAHFDVDLNGAVAQYVRVLEYAWATGNTEGNCRSISIEMADETLGPDWTINEKTWKSAARLAAWLFAFVIKARPDESNLFQHSHWYSTACAGPGTGKIWGDLVKETQAQYDSFTKKKTPPKPAPVQSKVHLVNVVSVNHLRTARYQDPPKNGRPLGPFANEVYTLERALVDQKWIRPGLLDGHYGSDTVGNGDVLGYGGASGFQNKYSHPAKADGWLGKLELQLLFKHARMNVKVVD